jgi:mycothiol system anti-sigma-R factor
MIDCHGVMKQLWEYLDGELPPAEAAQVRDHLAMCARCYPQYRHQLAFLALVSRVAASSAPRREFVRRLEAVLASAKDDPT